MEYRLDSHRASERGAVKIQTVLTLVLLAIATFIVIKIAPVYIEQRSVTIQADELARITAVRALKKEEVQKNIDKLRGEYDLPEGSIKLVSQREDHAQIDVKYRRTIDFLVTTYDWDVQYTASGKVF